MLDTSATSQVPRTDGASSLPRTPREALEFAALVVSMSALTTGPVYVVAVRVFDAPGTWEDGWIKYTFMAAALLGTAAWVSQALDRRLRRPDAATLLAATYTALAVASTLWSILPAQTLWRSLTYVGLLAIAWALASLSYRVVISFLVALGGLGVGLSLVAIIALPGVGRDGSGVWRGIYTNPNSLGPVCALLVIALAAVAADTTSPLHRAIALAVGVVALVPLYGSASETSMAGLVASLLGATVVVLVGVLWARDQKAPAVALAAVTVAAAALATAAIAHRLRSNSGIAIRVDVWRIVWERIWLKPGGGYGFFTYWDTAASRSPRVMARAGSAHNSALEATLGVGFAGFFLVVGLAALALVRSVASALARPSARTWTWLALTLFVVLTHMTESFVSWFSYMWVLLIVVAWGPRPDDAGTPSVG